MRIFPFEEWQWFTKRHLVVKTLFHFRKVRIIGGGHGKEYLAVITFVWDVSLFLAAGLPAGNARIFCRRTFFHFDRIAVFEFPAGSTVVVECKR